MTDGRGKLTRYSYTAFGNLKSVINPDSKVIAYKYDLSGNTACVTDKNGNSTVYTYDNMGQLLKREVAETGDSIKYTYDEVGNRKSMEDESGINTYTYDGNNRLLEIQKGNRAQISNAYDQVGNVAKVTDTKGNEVAYTYDKSNRMETVSNGGKTTTYNYDENGRRKSITYDGGVSEQYTYDKDNQLKHLANKKPNGVIISEYKYDYDLAGRQLSKTDSYGTTSYDYDKAGRITKVTAPGKTTVYAYDKAGNRISLNETYTSLQPSEYVDEATGKDIQYILKKSDYSYSSSNTLLKLVERLFDENNKELARKTTIYVYDNNGNQLKQSVSHTLPDNTKLRPATTGTAYGDNITGSIDKLVEKTSYNYDGFNRLKKTETIKDGIRTTAEYIYNGDDLRVSKTVKKSDNGYIAEVTNYLYDRQNVILETDVNSNIKARYIKGINYIAKTDAANKQSYFLFNGHGDVVQTVDEVGTLQNQYDYDIWGNPTLTIETTENAIRYSGEFMDSETGLYYLRARYYDPNIGRFISEDSYWGEDENPLSLNLYTYCHNDPIRYTDPTGHWPKWVDNIASKAKELANAALAKAEELANAAIAKAKALADAAIAKARALKEAAEAKARALKEAAEAKARALKEAAEAKARALKEAAEAKAKELKEAAVAKAKELKDAAVAKANEVAKKAEAKKAAVQKAEAKKAAEQKVEAKKTAERKAEAQKAATKKAEAQKAEEVKAVSQKAVDKAQGTGKDGGNTNNSELKTGTVGRGVSASVQCGFKLGISIQAVNDNNGGSGLQISVIPFSEVGTPGVNLGFSVTQTNAKTIDQLSGGSMEGGGGYGVIGAEYVQSSNGSYSGGTATYGFNGPLEGHVGASYSFIIPSSPPRPMTLGEQKHWEGVADAYGYNSDGTTIKYDVNLDRTYTRRERK